MRTPPPSPNFLDDDFIKVTSETELQAEINDLKNENTALKKTISDLEERLRISNTALKQSESKYHELVNRKKTYAEIVQSPSKPFWTPSDKSTKSKKHNPYRLHQPKPSLLKTTEENSENRSQYVKQSK